MFNTQDTLYQIIFDLSNSRIIIKSIISIKQKKLENKQNLDKFLAGYSSLLIGKVFLSLIKHHHTKMSVNCNTINIKHINKNNII